MAQHEPATPEQITERKQVIRNLITGGFTMADVVNKVREDYGSWGLSDRQIRNYCRGVYEDMSTDAGLVDRAAYFMRTLERIDHIHAAAMQTGNLKLALEATQSIAKLLKLDTPAASMDWRTAAKQAGLEPAAMVEQLAKLFGKGASSDIQQ